VRQIFLYLIILSVLKFDPAYAAADVNIPTTGVDAIYGRDDREFVTHHSSLKLREMALSIGYIVSEDYLERGFFKTLIKAKSLKETLNLCAGEKFESDRSVPNCSGFLVAPDVLVTAGHCFATEADCHTKKIIFDVDLSSQAKKGILVNRKNIYSCEQILFQNLQGVSDYAVIKLERATKNRPSLSLNLTKKIEDNESVFMLGHPFGLPLIISKKAKLSENTDLDLFKASLDSFEGNSGSPVINARTFKVEGILVNGQEDLVQDSEKLCYRNAKHVSGGEGVLRASSLPTF
jgi:hypothetical protein